jgi:hypothetical protein
LYTSLKSRLFVSVFKYRLSLKLLSYYRYLFFWYFASFYVIIYFISALKVTLNILIFFSLISVREVSDGVGLDNFWSFLSTAFLHIFFEDLFFNFLYVMNFLEIWLKLYNVWRTSVDTWSSGHRYSENAVYNFLQIKLRHYL